jgi:hypothetical protein
LVFLARIYRISVREKPNLSRNEYNIRNHHKKLSLPMYDLKIFSDFFFRRFYCLWTFTKKINYSNIRVRRRILWFCICKQHHSWKFKYSYWTDKFYITNTNITNTNCWESFFSSSKESIYVYSFTQRIWIFLIFCLL